MIEKNTPTGIAMIQVSATGENSICISAEANNHLTPERIKPFSYLISAAEMLLMQLETPIETIQAAAETAKLSGTVVVLNPAPAQSLSDNLLKLVDIITPNETEAEQLTGIQVRDMPSAQQAAEKLHNKGIEMVMITLGSQGVWLSQAGKGQQIKGFAVKAVDTTAAGDTFNGAFLTRLLEKASVEEAIRFAHAAAAITVSGKGAQTSIPYRQAVEQFLVQMDNKE
jgi:ribokinase